MKKKPAKQRAKEAIDSLKGKRWKWEVTVDTVASNERYFIENKTELHAYMKWVVGGLVVESSLTKEDFQEALDKAWKHYRLKEEEK